MLQLVILAHRNIHNGIPQSKAYQHKTHTSCDTEDRHKQSFFVPEHIPKARFPGKA